MKQMIRGQEVGHAGRPRSLTIHAEEKFTNCIQSEIAANHDPNLAVPLSKASQIRREETTESMDVDLVQIAWLKSYNKRHHTTISPAWSIEEVCKMLQTIIHYF